MSTTLRYAPGLTRFGSIAVSLWMLLASALCHATEPGAGFHVEKYELNLTPDFASKSVSGVETIHVRGLADGLQTIVFSGNALTIDAVTLDGQAVQATNTAKTLSLQLPRALPRGASATLRVKYHGVPKQGVVFGAASMYTTYFACDWMICSEDAPGDKAMFALDLHVPAGMTSLAVGELASTSKVKDGSAVDHWRLKRRYSAYLYDFAVGKFTTVTTQAGSAKLTYWSETATPEELRTLFAETGAMVAFLADKAGTGLPAGSYAQLLVPGKEAQETATYSILGRDYLDPKDDWAIIHELSHQWWGNSITCRTWQDFWLNEGITSFMVAAWKEQRYGRAAYDTELSNVRKGIDQLRDKGMKDYPLAFGGGYPNIRQRRAIQYGKGELFMDYLRTLLGERAFWAGLRSYTREHAGGTVTSIDFEHAMEKTSGRDLSGVFAEWVFGTAPVAEP